MIGRYYLDGYYEQDGVGFAEVVKFTDTYKHPEHLKLRDSLFWWQDKRIQTVSQKLKMVKIKYVDFTSLYPYGLYHCDEPIWALPILYVFMRVRECVCV